MKSRRRTGVHESLCISLDNSRKYPRALVTTLGRGREVERERGRERSREREGGRERGREREGERGREREREGGREGGGEGSESYASILYKTCFF